MAPASEIVVSGIVIDRPLGCLYHLTRINKERLPRKRE